LKTAKESENLHKSASDFTVGESVITVGIGASAGGLEAFKELLECLPADTGLSFVIIQHLAAGQESMLAEILSRFTDMPVQTVKDNTQIEANHVYVIPPGTIMTMDNKILKLDTKGSSTKPIDAFLISLAEDLKALSIGIILSGTGSDGTEGLKAIKAQGGITFAQSPESAQYSTMPQSVISADAADFVLPPEKIAEKLPIIAKNPQMVHIEIESKVEKGTKRSLVKKETGLTAIFSMLKNASNVDFSHYKDTVVNRRVSRRMVINNIDGIAQYVDYLRKHPNELEALYNDMLIGVTSFFREPETFDALKKIVFPALVKNRSSKDPIRIWIPGCSTGEEAYSFAIAIQEYLGENSVNLQVQIFGTDVNEKNVEKARQGIYLKTVEAVVNKDRLEEFFTSNNGNFQIVKAIRDMCVFAKQDITADPPFSNLDLVSCRNMLIYFDQYLHERIVHTLHYSLKLDGFLVLGASESIGQFTSFFEPVGKQSVIYVKKRAQPSITFGLQAPYANLKSKGEKNVEKKDVLSVLRDEMDRLLITEYVPGALLVNNDLDVLIFRGNVVNYVSPESGLASLNLARIIHKELRPEITSIIYRARKEKKPIKENAVYFEYAGERKTINIHVIPMHVPQYEEPFFLLLFEDVTSAATLLRQNMELSFSSEGQQNARDHQNRELREELDSTKQSLQRVIETQEATNEELRTTMEEAQSSNEELQSTNEELETAKEELQSSNEELKTLNDELKNRNQTLAQVNDDLTNLNRNVDPAIVMVDRSLRIRLFSPSAQAVLNLSPFEIGMTLTSIKLGIKVENLEKNIAEVISKLRPITKEVQDERGHYYDIRIRPYITQEDRIAGAIISFVDIHELRKYQRLANIGETAGMVGHDIRNPLQAITSDLYLLNDELKCIPESKSRKAMEESIESIEQNIVYIDKIISDLQDYTRAIKPNIVETKLCDLINGILAKTIVPKNVQTQLNIDADLTIKTDFTYIRRSLTNLIINAIQAMPNGGKLTINANVKNERIHINVEDTGVGIPEHVKPNLFKPLFTTKSKGQGLGLAVVKRLVEGLGGTVRFVSEEGNGTKFTIDLPLDANSVQ
jgi:two-component system CheB/CheR fusion protein